MITHAKLKKLDLQTALDLIRSTPLGFLMEVADNENYPKELRLTAAAAALPYIYGPPPGSEDK
jgi:hypothetical protein